MNTNGDITMDFCLSLIADENDYILRDFENEKLYGMSLPESIRKAQARPLFKVIFGQIRGPYSLMYTFNVCTLCMYVKWTFY